jgi:hypothetical protein
MSIRRQLLIASIAAGAALSALGSSPASSAPTVRTASSSESATAPVRYICDKGVAYGVMTVTRTPYKSYSYSIYRNGVFQRSGTVKATSTGVITARQYVANKVRSSVQLRLSGVSATWGYITPSCASYSGSAYIASPAPRGSSTAFSLYKNANGTVTRWNPCDGVIRVRVNPTGGGTGALQDSITAIKALAQATGLKFTYDGTTTFIPTKTNGARQPAHIVISWATRLQSNLLGVGAIGQGGWRSSGSSLDGLRWTWKITQGFVIVDKATKVTPGFGRGATRGALLLHELGHAAGLGHTNDAPQVMYPSLRSTSYASWGSGDRAGLKALGAAKGCVPTA